MIKTIFIDLDGTLSDSKKLAYTSLTKTLSEHEIKFSPKEINKMMGTKTDKILKELNIKKQQRDSIKKEFYKKVFHGIKKGKIKLCTQIDTLKKLKKDYKIILITNSHKEFAEAEIKKLKIKKLFDEIHTADSFTTKTSAIKKSLKKNKLSKKEAVYIGDRFSDVRYAKKAKIFSIAIHNKCSWSSRKEILKEQPDFIIKDFKNLKKVLASIS